MAAMGILLWLVAGARGMLQAAGVKAISPPGAQVVGPYTPGLLAGKFLYVSGQGARDGKGETPRTTADQIRQCLTNVKSIVEAAGLTMEHVVYAQIYLADAAAYGDTLAVWNQSFKDGGPARALHRMGWSWPQVQATSIWTGAKRRGPSLISSVYAPTPRPSGSLKFSSCRGGRGSVQKTSMPPTGRPSILA